MGFNKHYDGYILERIEGHLAKDVAIKEKYDVRKLNRGYLIATRYHCIDS
jgi:hypothetical protein